MRVRAEETLRELREAEEQWLIAVNEAEERMRDAENGATEAKNRVAEAENRVSEAEKRGRDAGKRAEMEASRAAGLSEQVSIVCLFVCVCVCLLVWKPAALRGFANRCSLCVCLCESRPMCLPASHAHA
jgi:Flp pilus assembly protein TadB